MDIEDCFLTEEESHEFDVQRRLYLKTWPQPLLTRLLWEMCWPERIALEANFLHYCVSHSTAQEIGGPAPKSEHAVYDLHDHDVILDTWIDLHEECPLDWQGNLGMGTMNEALQEYHERSEPI